ncbi:MAG TPA: lipoprotein-releasing ABC transporter permease subunit [Steroidobacteraceae bacterium]|nr:lipoprotein-releasing ABC transporter permease subunit [Steroidobacteraceae bacterium]
MSKPYEWLIATRYLRSGEKRGFLSFIALVSVIGLAVGVAVLIIVLSVMNGFERELKSRILSVTAHATLTGLEGSLPDWRLAQNVALKQPGVLAAVPYIEAQAILTHGQRVAGTAIRGVDPPQEIRAVGLGQRMQAGKLTDLVAGSYGIVLGDALATQLQARVGDDVVLVAPQGSATPAGVVPRMRHFHVAGIFHSGMYEFDRGLALIHITDAALLYRMGSGVSGIRLALQDPLSAPRVVRRLAETLGGGFYISDWTRNHANFFRNIEMTKSMLFLILMLVVAVAAFNIVAALVMVVKEKQSEIAILRTLGMGARNILGVFSLQGVLIGLSGTLLGAALGLLLVANLEALIHGLERLFHTKFLDASVYQMSDLPAYASWRDVLQICGVAFLLCALATLYPAWKAAGVTPAEGLRHD